MKICPNCDTENPDEATVCLECGMGISQIKTTKMIEETQKLEEIRERAKSLILTTGFEVEGQSISEYLGIVTSEVVMDIKPIEGLLGDIFDAVDLLRGGESSFELRLGKAKDVSLEKLKGKAALLGTDAIIGINMSYMTIKENILMVVTNGTAVSLSTQ